MRLHTDQPLQNVSVSVAIAKLLLPMLEVEAEVRLGTLLGLSAFGGVGQVSVDTAEDGNEELAVYELGGKVLFYPLEPFENLHLGAELLYLHVSSDELGEGDDIEGFGTGIAVGPLLGYKTISEKGFTFVVQGGVARVALHAEAESETDRAEDDDTSWVPLLNLNLGWSF